MSGQLPDLDEAISFAVDAGQQAGPFSMQSIIESVRSGQRAPSTLIWWAGEADWVAFDSVPGLVELLGAPAAVEEELPPPPAPVADPVADVVPDEVAPDELNQGMVTEVVNVEDVSIGETDDLIAEGQNMADEGQAAVAGLGAAAFGGLQPLSDATDVVDDVAGDVAADVADQGTATWTDSSAAEVLASENPPAGDDPWRDLPAGDGDTEILGSEDLAADFGSVSDTGSGLFETEPSDVFDAVQGGMPEPDPSEVDISDSVSGAFDAVAETADEAQDSMLDPAATETLQIDDFAAPAESPFETDGSTWSDGQDVDVAEVEVAEVEVAEVEVAAVEAEGTEAVDVEPVVDDVVDTQSSEPIAAADSAGDDMSSLQSVSERIDALGVGAVGGGLLGAGIGLSGDADDVDTPEVEEVEAADGSDDVEGQDIEAQVSDADEADIDRADLDLDPDTDGEVKEDDVDAAINELDEFADEEVIPAPVGDEASDTPSDAPPEDADLAARFVDLQAQTADAHSALDWSTKLDDVLLASIINGAQGDGYSLVDLHATGPSHLARFENPVSLSRLVVGLEQVGPTTSDAGISGHQTMVMMSWGQPVDGGSMPQDDDEGSPGTISTYGDADTGYAFSAVDLIWSIADYVDGDSTIDSDKVDSAMSAAKYALQRHWFEQHGS